MLLYFRGILSYNFLSFQVLCGRISNKREGYPGEEGAEASVHTDRHKKEVIACRRIQQIEEKPAGMRAGSGGEQRKKIGLLVEGGGMKCAYSAGVLDAFLDEGIAFDYCAGVSAGAANLVSYLAGQRDRNRRYYCIYVKDPRYLSTRNFIKTGSLFGLQYIYGDMTNEGGEDPLDFDALMANPSELVFPATDAAHGEGAVFYQAEICAEITTNRSWPPARCRLCAARWRSMGDIILTAEYRIPCRSRR